MCSRAVTIRSWGRGVQKCTDGRPRGAIAKVKVSIWLGRVWCIGTGSNQLLHIWLRPNCKVGMRKIKRKLVHLCENPRLRDGFQPPQHAGGEQASYKSQPFLGMPGLLSVCDFVIQPRALMGLAIDPPTCTHSKVRPSPPARFPCAHSNLPFSLPKSHWRPHAMSQRQSYKNWLQPCLPNILHFWFPRPRHIAFSHCV